MASKGEWRRVGAPEQLRVTFLVNKNDDPELHAFLIRLPYGQVGPAVRALIKKALGEGAGASVVGIKHRGRKRVDVSLEDLGIGNVSAEQVVTKAVDEPRAVANQALVDEVVSPVQEVIPSEPAPPEPRKVEMPQPPPTLGQKPKEVLVIPEPSIGAKATAPPDEGVSLSEEQVEALTLLENLMNPDPD